jgi:hypothetical protein
MTIKILSCGKEKEKAIIIVKEATGWGIKEARDFVESIELESQTLYNVKPYIAVRLQEIGAQLETYDEGKEESTDTPLIETNMIDQLDREGTMQVLKEAEEIAKKLENWNLDIERVETEEENAQKKADAMRKQISKKAKLIIWFVTIVAFFLGMAGGALCFLTGFVAYIIMYIIVGGFDLAKHEAENNAKADAYLNTYVTPLQARLDKLRKQRDELINSGKKEWAVDVVGVDLFYSACIHDLYDLVKNRRADNLKEALNKYDDTQYKARMEEMQASIKNASEVTAKEAVKQTEYSRDIAKNTHQTATAAKATAYHTRKIDKNTRKINKNTKKIEKNTRGDII